MGSFYPERGRLRQERNRFAIVTGLKIPESFVNALVDQNAHLGTCEQKVFCFFQSGEGRFTRVSTSSLDTPAKVTAMIIKLNSEIADLEKKLEAIAK
jgi:hypothetical protein